MKKTTVLLAALLLASVGMAAVQSLSLIHILKHLCNSTFSAADLLSEVLDGSREKVISELVHVKQMFSVHRLLQGIDLQPHLAV